MKKLLFTTLFILAAGLFTNMNAQSSKVYGTFDFDAETTAWEYQKGTIKIAKVAGKNTVTITFSEGGSISLEGVKIKKNTITGNASIQDETIDITMKVEKNLLKGTSTTSDGTEIPFKGKRNKKK